MMKEHSFIEISNREVYTKLVQIEQKIDKINGKVKLNRWIASTALSMGLLLIGLLVGLQA